MSNGWDNQDNRGERMFILSENNKNNIIICIAGVIAVAFVCACFYGTTLQIQETNRKFIAEGYEYKPIIEKEIDTEIDTTMSWVKTAGEK